MEKTGSIIVLDAGNDSGDECRLLCAVPVSSDDWIGGPGHSQRTAGLPAGFGAGSGQTYKQDNISALAATE